MAANVVLQTHIEQERLEFAHIVRYGDNASYACTLLVASGAFSARFTFYFESSALDAFLLELEMMDKTLQGQATLKPHFEDPYVKLETEGRGHVTVSGDLKEYSDLTQRLQFAFATDQTVLRPLIADLTAVKNGPLSA